MALSKSFPKLSIFSFRLRARYTQSHSDGSPPTVTRHTHTRNKKGKKPRQSPQDTKSVGVYVCVCLCISIRTGGKGKPKATARRARTNFKRHQQRQQTKKGRKEVCYLLQKISNLTPHPGNKRLPHLEIKSSRFGFYYWNFFFFHYRGLLLASGYTVSTGSSVAGGTFFVARETFSYFRIGTQNSSSFKYKLRTWYVRTLSCCACTRY